MLKIEYLDEEIPVYDITVRDNENFYANDILVHNCAEILLPVKPLKSLEDPDGEIALCILSNVNAGKIKSPNDLPRLAELLVRSLDNVIDIQEYPLPAAENSTINNRFLGIGVSDWAHYLSKKKVRYDTDEALDLSEEFMEIWQYNLLKASMELAKERGEALNFRTKSKYADGWLPNDGKWRFVAKELWEQLRKDIMKYGLRNLTLSAIPPAGCQTKSGKIQTVDGVKTIEDIFRENLDIDISLFENDIEPHWNNLKTPLRVKTRKGDTLVKRVWVNGKVKTKKIRTSDGSVQEFSLNHKLLVLRGKTKTIWLEVGNLQVGDKIVKIGIIKRKELDYLVIEDIQDSEDYTYDIEVPQHHEYLLDNGIVSHNTSSDVSNSTSGLDMPRDLIVTKK
ncbi:MAG: hypothetical protein DRG27_06175, partial [Deltaproteobacteria bacterium]